MISLTRISKFLKLNMIITLIIYALMYIFLFAPYSADAYDYAQDGNGDFDFRKMLIFMVVGLGVSLAFIIYHVVKNFKKRSALSYIFFMEIVHIIIVYFGGYITYGLFRSANVYFDVEKLPVYMLMIGVILLGLLEIANVVSAIVAVSGFIYCIINKICVKEEIEQNTTKLSSEIEYYRERAAIFSGWICAGVVALMIAIMVFASAVWSIILGIIPIVTGVILPLVLYQCIICVSWINNGKWAYMVTTYIMFIYIAYSMISSNMYVLIDPVLEIFGIHPYVVSIVMGLYFMIGIVVMIIYAIRDKRLVEKV